MYVEIMLDGFFCSILGWHRQLIDDDWKGITIEEEGEFTAMQVLSHASQS